MFRPRVEGQGSPQHIFANQFWIMQNITSLKIKNRVVSFKDVIVRSYFDMANTPTFCTDNHEP